MKDKWSLLAGVLAFCAETAKCQDSTALSLNVYGEVYYVYDFAKPEAHTRPQFVYSHNRTGEIAINLGFLKASYVNKTTRAHLAVMTGTYCNVNLASESGVLKNLYEANAGVRLSKHQEVWVDVGVLPSHIGFESAAGKSNWTLTRSLAADNSPYYETGVRITYGSVNQKWNMAVLVLNGWQRIQRQPGNHTVAFGTQVSFKPTSKILLNSSSFVGNDQPDSVRRMRYFHNLYGIILVNPCFGITLGFDFGLEQKTKGSGAMNNWYTPILILRTKLKEQQFISIRAEHFLDNAGVIINNMNQYPFSIWSYSGNFDWHLNDNILWRIECKWMESKKPAFIQQNGNYKTSNFSSTTALCFSF